MYINYGPGDGTGGSSNIILKGPVQDIPALQALKVPEDTETRQILDELPDIVKYTFNTLATSGLPANDGTPGFWNVSQKSTDGLRKTPATSTTILAATPAPDDYEIRRVNADISDPTSIDTEYVFNKGMVADTSKGDLTGNGGAWVLVIPSTIALRIDTVQLESDLKAVDAINYMKTRVENSQKEYVFRVDSTIPLVLPKGAIEDNASTGYWELVKGDGLRGNPVIDSTELTALEARDFELRQILGDNSVTPIRLDKQYVFKLGATIGDYEDDNGTGYWIEEKLLDEIKVDYITMTIDGQTNVPVAFDLTNILVFRNGLLAQDDTYQIAADKKSIDTMGERLNTVMTVVEISNGAKLTKKEKRCFGGEIDFDTGDDIGLKPLVFSNGMLLNDTEFTVSSVSSVTFNYLAVKNEVLSIVYKGN